ncbi:YciI family protein [Streptomyces sp. NPDC048604]|uniref:YciI family protein n=1 Tax=Streptomyces sp. NPDC048604 TaxID=3365578 RepID=UPI0037192BF9
MKYVVFYESADDVAGKAPAFFAEHVARYDKYVADGSLLMIGPFADPQQDGSMAIFATRQAAEDFVSGDPFVLHGVVRGWTIKAWDEALAEEQE